MSTGPGLPGAPQDEAGLTRKFETSHVGGTTCRTPPIPRSALEKDPRPGPLFEGNPVGEGTTRRGTATPVHRPQGPADSTHSSTRGLRPPEHQLGPGLVEKSLLLLYHPLWGHRMCVHSPARCLWISDAAGCSKGPARHCLQNRAGEKTHKVTFFEVLHHRPTEAGGRHPREARPARSQDRKSTRLNSSHKHRSRMPSSA